MARPRKQQKAAENEDNVARRIWLAGLGAYGKSVQDQIGKASQEASRLFDELVSKGQGIEELNKAALEKRLRAAKGRFDEARERISEVAGGNTRSVEDMIGRVREKLGLDIALHDKIDALSQQITSLARGMGDRARRRATGDDQPPAAKPSRKARTPTSAAKAPAKPAARRGRPPKAATADAPRRGRPPKVVASDAPSRGRPPKTAAVTPPAPRRGRPPKAAAVVAEAPRRGRPPKAAAKRRGRPPKATPAA